MKKSVFYILFIFFLALSCSKSESTPESSNENPAQQTPDETNEEYTDETDNTTGYFGVMVVLRHFW